MCESLSLSTREKEAKTEIKNGTKNSLPINKYERERQDKGDCDYLLLNCISKMIGYRWGQNELLIQAKIAIAATLLVPAETVR